MWNSCGIDIDEINQQMWLQATSGKGGFNVALNIDPTQKVENGKSVNPCGECNAM